MEVEILPSSRAKALLAVFAATLQVSPVSDWTAVEEVPLMARACSALRLQGHFLTVAR
jgi:hypothetical protein